MNTSLNIDDKVFLTRMDEEVITWLAAGELDDISYLEGVGGFGEAYSTWGSGVTDKKGSAYDDGYSESRDCVK